MITKKVKIVWLFILISISVPLFPGNTNQGMSLASTTEDKPKIRSVLKRRYKPRTKEEIAHQEEIVDITKLNVSLRAFCLSRIIDSYILIDENNADNSTEELEQNNKFKINAKEFQDFIDSRSLSELLNTIKAVKKAGYRNKKLVEALIKLTENSSELEPDSSDSKELAEAPAVDDLRNYFIEAAFLGDAHLVSLLISKDILKEKTDVKTENGIRNIEEIESELRQRWANQQSHNMSNIDYANYDTVRQYNIAINDSIEKALYSATRKNHIDVVKVLLDSIELSSYIKNEGVHYAKTKEMVSIYLAKNAKLNSSIAWSDDAGILGEAVRNNDIAFIDFLLENGASPLSSCDDISALTYVLEKMASNDPIIKEYGKQILKKFAHHSPHTFLISVITNEQIPEKILKEAIIIALNTNLIDINEQDPDDNWTALMLAAERSLYQIVLLLLERGANTSLKNDEDQTALDRARLNLNRYQFHVQKKEVAQNIVDLLELFEITHE